MGTGGDDREDTTEAGSARYVFGARVRLAADDPDLSVDPDTVEVKLSRRAAPPGSDGWLFFRDYLWRGELGDERFFRAEVERELGVDVESVDFRELRTDEAYLAALEAEIGQDLAAFNADSVREVLHKYLGSSVHVVDHGA